MGSRPPAARTAQAALTEIADGLVDQAKVQAAVDDLIKRKPHLAARGPTGSVGQGARPEPTELGLASMLRRGA